MKRISWAIVACGLCVGCGEAEVPVTANPPHEAPEATRLPVDLAIIEKHLNEPLTRDEVEGFIQLVKSFPDGQPPKLTPVSAGAKVQGLRVEQAIREWRGAVRQALTVDMLVQGWNPPSPVRRTLTENRITPRAMLSLMLRLSCTIGADAMGGRRQVKAQRVLADEKIDQIVARIVQLDRQRQPIPDSYWQSLEEACSLAEYLAILSEVPAENSSLVADYKEDLLAMLPQTSNPGLPAETHEEDRIVPVHYESASREPVKSTKSTRPAKRTADR